MLLDDISDRLLSGIIYELPGMWLTELLTDDPDHTGPGLRLVQRVKVLAKRRDDALVLVRILAEYILDDDNSLLYHVVHLGQGYIRYKGTLGTWIH